MRSDYKVMRHFVRWALFLLFLLALPAIAVLRLLRWLATVLEFSLNVGMLLARKYWDKWRK